MRMTRYGNLNGNSGVAAYSLENDSITVRFVNGGTYLYTSQSVGVENIKLMQKLAQAGQGLSTFISTHVSERYAAKLS